MRGIRRGGSGLWLSAVAAALGIVVGLPVLATASGEPTPASVATPPATARAVEASGNGSAEEAASRCREELEALCPGAKTRRDRIRCIRANRARLPHVCRRARRQARRRVHTACSADIERLCRDVEPGRARFRCIVEHRPELSETCRQAIDARTGRLGPVRRGEPAASPSPGS